MTSAFLRRFERLPTYHSKHVNYSGTGLIRAPLNLGEVDTELLTPEILYSDEVIFSTHCGGFTYGNCEIACPFVARLAKTTGLRV